MGLFKGIVLSFGLFVCTNVNALSNSQPAFNDSNNFNVWIKINGDSAKSEVTGLCNGSLVAEDLVLTAAHCLLGFDLRSVKVDVDVGGYKTFTSKSTGKPFTLFQVALDSVRASQFYFLNSINSKIKNGKISTLFKTINASDDLVLLQLERPVDRTKVNLQVIDFVNTQEHAEITRNPKAYTFIALTTNLVAEIRTTDYRRYAELAGINFKSQINKVYGLPMTNPRRPVETVPGDSGGPVLVNVSGQWKLFATIKGTKRDQLSTLLEDALERPVSITPEVNIYTPVANAMCELLESAGRGCN